MLYIYIIISQIDLFSESTDKIKKENENEKMKKEARPMSH